MKALSYDKKDCPQWMANTLTPAGHYFWLPHPQHYQWAFTARLIYQRGYLDLVPHRYKLEGIDEININDELKILTAKLKENRMDNTSEKVIHLRSDDRDIIASPNGSYGYLYTSIWRKAA